MSTVSRPNYRLRRWFTPDDHNTPFLTIDYNTLYQVRAVVDKAGNRTQYYSAGLFGGENQARGEILDAEGGTTTQYFDKTGQLLSSMDPLGRTTWRTYDDRQRLKSVIAPEGNATEYTYDVRSNVLTETRRPKPGSAWLPVTTTMTYVEGPAVTTCSNPARCNKVATIADYKNQATDYTYNTLGQLTRVRSPATGASGVRGDTNYCYTSLGAVSFLTGVVDVVGTNASGVARPDRVKKYSYNSANKYVLDTVRIDPSDSLTTACAATSKSGALNLSTTLVFDTVGNVRTINGPKPDSPVADITTYTFDSMRRLRQIDGPAGTNVRTVYDYYADGLLYTTDRQEMVSGSPVMRRETRTYWPTGDLRTVTDPEGHLTQYAYDAVGRMEYVTDPDNRVTRTEYDAAGQITRVWKGWGSTQPGFPIRYAEYTYTPNGKQDSVKDANGNTTRYVFDKHDRLRYTFFPNSSDGSHCTAPSSETLNPQPVCALSNGATPTYEEIWYTTDGSPTVSRCSGDFQPCLKRTRRGQAITYRYDERNRLYTRNATGLPVVTYSYNRLSELLSITSPASSDGSIPAHGTVYDYDDAGRKLFEDNQINGAYRRVTYGYDEAGNRTNTLWPDGYLVSYEYDVLNRMSKVWEGLPSSGFKIADYTYDSLSRRQSLRYASSATNETTYTYEPDSQLDLLNHNLQSGHSFSLNYGHNNSGQINSINASDDFFLPAPPASATTPYVPDRLNRYSSVGGQASTYDNNGNLLTWYPTGGRHTYTYDSENRLRTAATNGSSTPTITYDYDGLGRRFTKNANGTRTGYLLDGDEEIAEYSIDSGGVWAAAPLRRYVLGPAIDDRVATIDVASGTRNYFHVNHQGSVLAMTNSTGDTTCTGCQRMSFDEYGRLGNNSITLGQPYRFTGRRFDEETGLYYYRARYYSPDLGRFLQTDPVGYEDDLNLYAYVGNDPLNLTDPTGRESACVTVNACANWANYAPSAEEVAGMIPGAGYVEAVNDAAAGRYAAAGLGVAMEAGGGKYLKAAGQLLGKLGRSFSEKVTQSVKSFLKGNPIPTKAGNIDAKNLPNDGVAVQATKEGNVPGSKAVYEKQIDSAGNTVQSTKTTYDPQGDIVHVKDKLTGETFTPCKKDGNSPC